MELRPELMPPVLDEALVKHLAKLADRLDGAAPGTYDEMLAEFNRLGGTEIPFEHFQGVYGGESHADWARRLLTKQRVRPAKSVTREELIEVVRRAMPQNE